MGKIRKIKFGFIVFVVLLLGCATVEPLKTPTGRPEVTFLGVTKKKVVDALTNRMLTWGYQIKNISDYSATYGKRFESFLYYSRGGGNPERRINYAIVGGENNIRVVATVEIVANPGTAYEKVYGASGGAHDIQNMLEELVWSLSQGNHRN